MLPLIIFFICLLRPTLAQGSSGANGAAGSGGGVYGGRHSYSLSTFSPSGDIDQVVRAMRASMLGVPIVALSIPSTISADADTAKTGEIEPASGMVAGPTNNNLPPSYNSLPPQGGIYLSIPLRALATSPILIDDGTPRVVQVTSSTFVSHTGVGADGRVLCDVAIKLALDYRCVYGEEMPVEELLEGLAEKVQDMTKRAGSRPFGCALLVGCLGSYGGTGPTMYRIDPSGAVNSFHSGEVSTCKETYEKPIIDSTVRKGSVAFLGNWDSLRQKKDAIRSQLESKQFANEEELQDMLINVAQQTYADLSSIRDERPLQPSVGNRVKKPVLFASFTRERGLQISRIMSSIS